MPQSQRALMGTSDRPLFLAIEAKSKFDLDAAVAMVREHMGGETAAANAPHEDGGVQFVQEKIFVGLSPLAGFDLKGELLGPGETYIRHICGETQARVWLRGLGSVRTRASAR